jgi:hypothetical protein
MDLEIGRNGRRDASWFGAASSNLNPWHGVASERRLIGFHKFGRARQTGQGGAFEAGAAEIMARFAVPVAEPMNVL